VLEPVRRDSGPAVAVSALLAFERDAEALVLVLASDHVVRKLDEFRATCRCAAAVAAQGRIVTFGIRPTCAATNYGYIRPGKRLNGASVHEVEAFVEKPDAATAAKYVADHYFWNSGNFLFHAATMWQEIEHFEPLMAQAAKAAVAGATRDLDFLRLAPEDFARAPKKSIDYAVMEHTKHAAVVPVDMGWSDVGSWQSLWEIAERDANGNAAEGDIVALNVSNSYLRSEGPLLAAVGVDDVVVVATQDAVLVTRRSATQNVKKVVEEIERSGRHHHLHHRQVFRPWGAYDSIDCGDRFQVKRIVVNPGAKLSLQMHHHRAEHWIVVSGTAKVTCDDNVFLLRENESTFIPLGAKHRLENPGTIPLHLIEVQSGSYLGEDDIVRFEDHYGRSP